MIEEKRGLSVQTTRLHKLISYTTIIPPRPSFPQPFLPYKRDQRAPIGDKSAMTAEQITGALGGRWTGKNGMARCTAHDDSNPSLSVSDGRDGRVLVRCFGGCTQSSVLESLRGLGITLDGDSDSSYRIQVERKTVVQPNAASVRQPIAPRVIETTYRYTDERGELLYEVVRYRPKGFSQRYPDGRGGWVWKKHPQQVLYNLPAILKASICLVVEGEKDVAALTSRGFATTTHAGGSNAPWLSQFTEALRDREVVLIPDSDPPGLARVRTIAAALLGNVRRLRVLMLPMGIKDPADYFEAGHSETGFLALLEGVNASN